MAPATLGQRTKVEAVAVWAILVVILGIGWKLISVTGAIGERFGHVDQSLTQIVRAMDRVTMRLDKHDEMSAEIAAIKARLSALERQD